VDLSSTGTNDPPVTPVAIQRVYYALNALFTLSASLIWGVNTLFLLDAGLDIFLVMAVNATFSASQIVFEVPTGVIADTIGRRASFLIGIAALILSTLGYVGSAVFDWGLAGFVVFSVLLGFGFTCQTGAVDAWLVDALDASGYVGSKDRVFARSGVFTGISMLAGTVGGGLLGQLDLTVPYFVRSALLVVAFAVTFAFMREIGFKPRPLRLADFAEESRKILRAGVNYGWRHRVVRPLLFTSFMGGFLGWYLFYASQPYALELLGRGDLVWVAGLVTALFAASGVVGNLLVARVSRSRFGRQPARVLTLTALGMTLSTAGLGLTGLLAAGPGVAGFVVMVCLLFVGGLCFGILTPIRQAFLNDHIPSAQRATVLSFDSFFGDIGAVVGQMGLGYAARALSLAAAYAIGGALDLLNPPLYRLAGRAARRVGPPSATSTEDSRD
jgi:MFS family permease